MFVFWKKQLIDWLLRKYGSRRLAELERCNANLCVKINALEAECRMYRIRLGWEMPGFFAQQGHWVWHANDGSQKPFPGVHWYKVLPPGCDRIKDYRD